MSPFINTVERAPIIFTTISRQSNHSSFRNRTNLSGRENVAC